MAQDCQILRAVADAAPSLLVAKDDIQENVVTHGDYASFNQGVEAAIEALPER